jgi:hypothetical protein
MRTPTLSPTYGKVMKGLALGALIGLSACASPLHLTYDFGRAFTEAFTNQADLTRPSVANSTYSLYGQEAAEIRIKVRDVTTKAASGQSQLKN